jgi:hypothetical protein
VFANGNPSATMKKITLLALLVLPTLADATSPLVNENANAIKWTVRKLTWDDFQGVPAADSHGDAATAIRIKAEPYYKRKKLYYEIHAWFIPSKSWYRYKTDELLAHEQLHFDIAELFARQARQKVAELQAAGEKDIDVYNNAIQEILNRSNEVDHAYDRETLHGSLPRAQASWRLKTDIELMLLQQYEINKAP